MVKPLTIVDLYVKILNGDKVKLNNVWSSGDKKDNFKRCFLYLVNEHLHLTKEEIIDMQVTKVLKKYHLINPLTKIFGTYFNALNYIYPEWKLKLWEIKRGRKNWESNPDLCREAARWLILDKHKMDRETFLSKGRSEKFFIDEGLYACLKSLMMEIEGDELYKVFRCFKNLFPEWDLQMYEFKRININGWSDEDILITLKHLFEIKLKWTINDIKNNVNSGTFHYNGVDGIFNFKFKGNIIELLKFTYPNEDWESKKLNRVKFISDKIIQGVIKNRSEGFTYGQLMIKYNIRSKDVIHRIITGTYKNKDRSKCKTYNR